jgi:hypothetical protein
MKFCPRLSAGQEIIRLRQIDVNIHSAKKSYFYFAAMLIVCIFGKNVSKMAQFDLKNAADFYPRLNAFIAQAHQHVSSGTGAR